MNIQPWIFLFILFFSSMSWGWETDQYTYRSHFLIDSLPLLNQTINEGLEEIVESWPQSKPKDEIYFIKQIYKKFSQNRATGRLEEWIIKSQEIDKTIFEDDHVYAEAPFWASRGNWLCGGVASVCSISPTIRVNNIRIGVDKISHFFSEGYAYYKTAFFKAKGEKAALLQGVLSEKTYFGLLVSAVYSNADLVANYEGFRFFKNIFHADERTDEQPYIRWENNRPVLTRFFDWSDYISEYWDEVLLPSHYTKELQKYMNWKLKSYCHDYLLDPMNYILQQENMLKTRYSHIGLKYSVKNRLDHVCKTRN